MRVFALTRAIALAALGVCGLAVSIARSEPRPTVFRLRSEAPKAIVSGAFLPLKDARTQVLDTATGALSPLPIPEGETLDAASFSAWVDDAGEREVVGRGMQRAGDGRPTGAGLGRVSYPSGRVLDRIDDAPVPASAPCWYPQAAPRVLYPTYDGTLFEYTFGAVRPDGSVAPGKAARVAWPAPPPALGVPCVHGMAWPSDPRLGGRILAAVAPVHRGDGTKMQGRRRLWWLRLSADGHRVEDAVRADDRAPGTDPSLYEEALPSLGRAPDGRLLAAYRRVSLTDGRMELCVAPIEADAQTGVPVLRLALARTVVDADVGVPAAFAPDGRALFALHRAAESVVRLQRHALDLRPWAVAPGSVVSANDDRAE